MAMDTAKPLADGFHKKYPFLKVNYIRVGTAQMINRVINETLAGKWDFDAVTVLGMDALVNRNIFTPYMSPERSAFDDEFKDSKGLWTGVYHNNISARLQYAASRGQGYAEGLWRSLGPQMAWQNGYG